MAILLVAVCALIATQLEGNSSRNTDDQSGIDPTVVLPGGGEEETYSISTEPAQVDMVYPTTGANPKGENGDEALYYGYAGKVFLMVQSSLYDSISTSLNTYREDLEREGYTVQIYKWSGGTQKTFRQFLVDRKTNLTGAVLIGELPIPWYNNSPWCTGDTFREPMDLPYMDLDGTWNDKDNDGDWDSADPSSPFGPEIWIGRLYAANLDSVHQASAINDYLYRNHQYRLGNTIRPSKALHFINYVYPSGGVEKCTYGSAQQIRTLLEQLYDTVVCVDSASGGNEKQGYLDSLASNYEFAWIYAHGGGTIQFPGHGFTETNETVYFYDILHAKSKALFMHNFSCSGTRWTMRNCPSSYYIFGNSNDTTSGLAAWGVTVTGGFTGYNDFYPALAEGRNFGEALKASCDSAVVGFLRAYPSCNIPNLWVCYDSTTGQYRDSCWFHPFESVAFLGDPTLKPRKKIWRVNAAGTGDAPTIQAAIDSANYYDMIQLKTGSYTGTGNKNLDFKRKPITVSAETDTSNVIIDCQNSGRGFYFHSRETDKSRLVGVTIKNGLVTGNGGGMLCDSGSAPQIINCLLLHNRATGNGGGIALLDSARATITSCTMVFDSANSGGGIYLASNSRGKVQQSVVAYSRAGGGICYSGSDSTLVSCSNIYGNNPSNYSCSYSFLGRNSNIALNPVFCDTTNGNFKVDNTSPNQPLNNACRVWLGSTRKGCSSRPCGDANGSYSVNISDAIYIQAYIYSGGPAPVPLSIGDVNCDSAVNISDMVYLIAYIFSGGPAPCALCP